MVLELYGTRVLKERKIEKAKGRGIVPGALLKLLVKDKPSTSQQRSTCERERMAAETPEERERRFNTAEKYP